jgi:hypothetical protein
MFEALGTAMYNEAKLSETVNKLAEKALQEAVDELNQETNSNECCEGCDKECEEECTDGVCPCESTNDESNNNESDNSNAWKLMCPDKIESLDKCEADDIEDLYKNDEETDNVDVDACESNDCVEYNECEKSFKPFQVEDPIYVPTYTSADYTGPQFSAEIMMTKTVAQPETITETVVHPAVEPLETTDLPEGPNVTPIIRAHESDVYTFSPKKTLDSKVDETQAMDQTIVETINDETLKQVLADMESEKQPIADTIESDKLNTKEKSTIPDSDCEGKECSVNDTIKCECVCDKEKSNNFKRYAKIGGTVVVSFVVAALGARFFFSRRN